MDFCISGEPPTVPGWFYKAKSDLFNTWVLTQGVDEPWACEIGRGCRSCAGELHLSLPCSLASEANMIGAFLAKDWREAEFQLFFRLYLVMLSEFVNNLQDVANQMSMRIADPPDDVCFWCNKVAKHRIAILIQHHPAWVIADKYGAEWPRFEALLPNQTITDSCCTNRPLDLISGRTWFKGKPKADTLGANDDKQAVVVIPPLLNFLVPTVDYFRRFVDTCHHNPDLVQRFQSQHYASTCFGWN